MKSLRLKFIAYAIPLVIVISLSFLFFFIARSNGLLKQQLAEIGFSLSENLAYSCELGMLAEDANLIEAPLTGIFKKEDIISVVVYNQEGEIVASKKRAEINQRMPENVLKTIKEKRVSLKMIDYTQDGKEIYSFFSPIIMTGLFLPQPKNEPQKLLGFVKIGISLEKIEYQNRLTLLMGLGIVVLFLLLGVSGNIFLVRRITKPLKVLTEGVEAIGKGNLDYRIRIKTGDEFEDLGGTFNQMAEDLKKSRVALEESREVLEVKITARTKELQELAASLEEKVKERTKELQEKINELERFQKLTVGRELKMAELKKEIERLKGRQ